MPAPVSEQSALGELDRAAGPAWIIDAAAARILAANAAGAGIFAVGGVLDAAMPAVARLRDIARGIEPVIDAERPLGFWTAAGPRVFACVIRLVERPCGRAALLVMSAGGDAPPERVKRPGVPAARPPDPLANAPESVPGSAPMADPERHSAGWQVDDANESQVDEAPRAMDDAATLREIARRIIEGEKALAAASGDVPVTPAPAAFAVVREEDEPAAPALPIETAAKFRDIPGSVPPDQIAQLAHELKTPLSAIAAASEVMKDERLGAIGNERYRDYAADIHTGAQHALALIERMLTRGVEVGATTADGGLSGMTFAAVDLNAIAGSCLSSMQPLAGKAGIKVSADLAPSLPPLTADATSLRQILLNLLTNAVKFARPGDGVRVVTRKDAAGAIVLEVRDTGPGMSRAEIARALNSLESSGPAQRRGGGLGMGLPLVRSLVEANAGRLAIDSTPGKGTAVSVTFPRNRLIAI